MVSPERLTDYMHNWWVTFLEQSNIGFGPNEAWNIEREENMILLRSPGRVTETPVRHILGFDKATAGERKAYVEVRQGREKRQRNLVPAHAFFAFDLGRSAQIDVVRAKFDNHLTDKLKETYKRSRKDHALFKATYFDPQIGGGLVDFNGTTYEGIYVRSPVVQIPTGDAGGISGKLFETARVYLLSSLNKALG